MLQAFGMAFKTPELRKKIFFTLSIMALFRFGSIVPTPGVDYAVVKRCLNNADTGGLFGLINLFSGGALLQLSVFALGIMPYITASIIVQLLTVVIPRFETLKEEGQSGTAKLTQYTRYLTIGLAVLQSTGLVAVARTPERLIAGCNEAIIFDTSWHAIATMIVVMTAGTSVVMWLGELITDRGIGNGMSILIFTSIAASFPGQLWSIRLAKGLPTFIFVLLIGVAIVAAVVFVEQSQRRIPVQYAKRMVGRQAYGGTSTYIPIKVNQAGVIPVIFASSLLYIPSLLVNFSGNQSAAWAIWISRNLVGGDTLIYVVLYAALIIFFAYFYVAITFNPDEVADNMKKYGGFIPGIRAGRPTSEYLAYVLSRITAPGSLYLALVAIIPIIALTLFGASQNFPFGGTAILIVVGVGLDTAKQIESQLQQRSYEGFLK
ncbi:MAG: preprotein translocase subunit SecY [Actinobacteria bacterium]|uniref:Protein translocase subunit SecY n=1 Tax=freshwater metagenome TaxID=449393 RepID=A0A6J6CPB6_9ZZZZ|nr:preprotein translocase subunit SecY [Actinomycetota bacterium]